MNTIRGQLGEYGSDILCDTTAKTGYWMAVTAYTSACIFTVMTDTGATVTGTPGTLALAQGQTVYGSFVALTLSSGVAKAYKARSA